VEEAVTKNPWKWFWLRSSSSDSGIGLKCASEIGEAKGSSSL
jgi:hypothetical protein